MNEGKERKGKKRKGKCFPRYKRLIEGGTFEFTTSNDATRFVHPDPRNPVIFDFISLSSSSLNTWHQSCPDNKPTHFNGQNGAYKKGGCLSGEHCIYCANAMYPQKIKGLNSINLIFFHHLVETLSSHMPHLPTL